MMTEFFNYALNGALLGMLYALVAMGFVVIYRASKVFNMAVGEMIVLGAFLLWWAIQSRGLHPALGIGVALLIAVVVGLLIERLLFRRLIGESVFSMIMVTIGLLILMRGLVLVIWGPQERQFPAIFPLAPLIVFDMIVPRALAAGGVIAVLAALGLHWFSTTAAAAWPCPRWPKTTRLPSPWASACAARSPLPGRSVACSRSSPQWSI